MKNSKKTTKCSVNTLKILPYITVWLLASACATARLVESEPGKGGVIAISPSGSAEAKDKAKIMMASTCDPDPYKIVKEGETVVGSSTSVKSTEKPTTSTSLFGKKTAAVETEGTSTTSNLTEWRLTFKCGGAPAKKMKKATKQNKNN